MRSGLARYDTDVESAASIEEGSDLSSELDLLNPRVTGPRRPSRFSPENLADEERPAGLVSSQRWSSEHSRGSKGAEAKLLFDRVNEISGKRDARSLRHLPRADRSKKYEVTFAEEKRSGLKEKQCGKSSPELWDGKGTPRIVRAIRRSSKKLNPVEDRSTSPGRPRPDNSKSSVVVLYHGQPSSPASSSRRIRSSKSDQTVLRSPVKPETNDGQSQSLVRTRPTESPDSVSPRYSLRRRKIPARRYRRASRRRQPLKVYQENRLLAANKAHRDHWTGSEGLEGKSEKRSKESSVEQERRTFGRKGIFVRNSKERCCPSDPSGSKLMAHRFNSREEGDTNQRSVFCPNLSFLQRIQQMQRKPGDELLDEQCEKIDVLTNASEEAKRVFPFQATPSGNLKIIPNQVVFESKKVSVLVADPRRTKVNVKAELSRQDVGRSVSESSTRPPLPVIDLPPGVTPSTIDQLQAQKRLPNIQAGCRPRTQPFKPKAQETEMEQKPLAGPTTHRSLPTNEVLLSSLGFTSEQPIDWDNIILPDKSDLYQELATRITNYKNADCIVRLGHDEFHCHLLVLQSYSTFFDEKNCKEIDLTDSNVTSRAFSIIYDWMISPISESCHLLRRDNILEIFMAAQYLGIKELEEQCWAFIDNDELFTEDTAFLLYMEARKVGNKAVMELMVPRIMKFFLLLVSTRDFLELSVEELCLLLRSNYICVNSEMEVLMSAVRWLMYDWEGRRQSMLDVLKCVRFGLIAPWQLVDVKRNPENPEFMELMSYPEVQKMVDDGLAFVIIKYWYGNQTEDYYHWIDLLGLTEPTDRNWAGEDKNYVTYREFLLYLDEYQKTKIPELKSRKSRVKPTPPSSPPKDSPAFQTKGQGNYPSNHIDAPSAGQSNGTNNAHASRHPSKCLPTNRMPMPPEILCQYLSSMDKSNAQAASGTLRNEEKIYNPMMFDARFNGGGECIRRLYKSQGVEKYSQEIERGQETIVEVGDGKLDYQKQRRSTRGLYCLGQEEPNPVPPSKKQRHQPSMEPVERTDSAKSEVEAATTIQAIYRGYKARRRFNQIRKSSSEEKQNARKVAELLAVPNTQQNLHKPLEPIKVSNSCANQSKSEKGGKQMSLSPRSKRRKSPSLRVRSQQQRDEDRISSVKDLEGLRFDIFTHPVARVLKKPSDLAKPIRTIKSPAFTHNYDERTNSVSPSDNTDTDDPFFPRADNNNGSCRKRNEGSCQAGEDPQHRHSRTKEIQTWPTQYKRPLPQRISNSVLGIDAESYLYESSLFFMDREAVLVFGGVDPREDYGCPGNSGKDVYRFKPDENAWELVGEIPEARHHHSVAYLRGRVYLVGGAYPRKEDLRRHSLVVDTVWSYDPTTRSWFDEPGLLTARKNFALIVSHGRMYAIGGQDRSGTALKTVEAFDPLERAWREMQPMHTARVGAAGIKYRDLIWVAGGMTKSKKELFSKDVECYDPIKNQWLKAEILKSPRCFSAMYVVADCLYITGGASMVENEGESIDSIDSIDIWDPKVCRWIERTRMSIARHGHCVGSVGYQLLIIGGTTTTTMETLSSVECFCCERNTWIKGVSALPRAISGHSTVSLPPANLLMDS